jgi:hypothetical protein
MTIIQERTLYRFDELPTDDAKERALEKGREWAADDMPWAKEWRDDMEHALSDEAISESLIANEHMFDERGRLA